jgi:hypothetical protein
VTSMPTSARAWADRDIPTIVTILSWAKVVASKAPIPREAPVNTIVLPVMLVMMNPYDSTVESCAVQSVTLSEGFFLQSIAVRLEGAKVFAA